MQADEPEMTVVTTLYRSQATIEAFTHRMTQALVSVTDNYQLIFVNDGSSDQSLDIALALQKRDKRIEIIDLSRNFGHHQAIMCGLAKAKGKRVFVIDCDLEEDPELLLQFYNKQNETNADAVYGVQSKRGGGIFAIVSGWLFYKLLNLGCAVKIPQNCLVVRLMKKDYVQSLLLHNEHTLFWPGLCQMTGYVQVPVQVERNFNSPTTYTLRRKLSLAVNALTSFNYRPLHMIFYVGFFISFFSALLLAYVIVEKVLYDTALGWASLIASVWFLGGLTIFSLGIMSIYLSKIFVEVKDRPNSIIKRHYKNASSNNDKHT